MAQESNGRSHGVSRAPTAPQGYLVTLTVEYDAQTETEARTRALRDAEYLIQQPDVLAVTADGKKAADELFPLTKEREMREILAQGRGDVGGVHYDADKILCRALKLLGYHSLVDLYEQVPKWYA